MELGSEKRKEILANRRIDSSLYNLRIKVDTALNNDISYTKVSQVDDISWKLIDCLVEHKVYIKIYQRQSLSSHEQSY